MQQKKKNKEEVNKKFQLRTLRSFKGKRKSLSELFVCVWVQFLIDSWGYLLSDFLGLFWTLLLPLLGAFLRFRDRASFGTRRARFSLLGICIWRCFIRRIGTSLIGFQRCQTPFQRVIQRLSIFQARLINHKHYYVQPSIHLRLYPYFLN